MGVWAPKHVELSIPALAQYTTPKIPPENPWIDRSRSRPGTPRSESPSQSPVLPASPAPSSIASPTAKTHKNRRPPSRKLVRHVLRARIEAAKALRSLFAQLELAPEAKRVCAAGHLARAFGGVVDPVAEGEEGLGDEPQGWRSAREVVAFLRARGAKIAQLEDKVPGEWAAVSSEGEGEGTESDSGTAEDLVWVPSSSSLREESS